MYIMSIYAGAFARLWRSPLDGALFLHLPPAIDLELVAAALKAWFGPLNLVTVVRCVAALSTAYKLQRLTNPCMLACVRTLLSCARR